MPVRLNAKQLRDLIEEIEANGGDAAILRRELEALEPEVNRKATIRRGPRVDEEEPTTEERLNNRVGDLFPNGLTNDLLARIIEMDRNRSLNELRAMCREAGLSNSGDKKELAAKLIAHNEYGR